MKLFKLYIPILWSISLTENLIPFSFYQNIGLFQDDYAQLLGIIKITSYSKERTVLETKLIFGPI